MQEGSRNDSEKKGMDVNFSSPDRVTHPIPMQMKMLLLLPLPINSQMEGLMYMYIMFVFTAQM